MSVSMSVFHVRAPCLISMSVLHVRVHENTHQYGHEHTDSMYNGHGHAARNAAWTWACSMDMIMQHGYGHGAWTWTYSMDITETMDITCTKDMHRGST